MNEPLISQRADCQRAECITAITANPDTAFCIAMETALYSSKRGGDIRRRRQEGRVKKQLPSQEERRGGESVSFSFFSLTDFTAHVALHHL